MCVRVHARVCEVEKETKMKMISLDVNRDLLFFGLSLADTTIGTSSTFRTKVQLTSSLNDQLFDVN